MHVHVLRVLRLPPLLAVFVTASAALVSQTAAADPLTELRRSFATPPDSARPWVYWTWLNSNVTREGITADLEAMRRVGIGGALILDVDQGTPPGPVKFFDTGWRDLFRHAVAEAARLGLELNMNNGVGYFGSGGPWVKPEQGMQWIFASETRVPGGARWTGTLPQPARTGRDYRDLAVYAVAEPAASADPKTRFKIADFEMKALYWKTWVAYRGTRSAPTDATAPASAVIPLDRVVDLTSRMTPDGTLDWDAPPGEWTVLRLGHASNGSEIGPALRDQRGLETDKLSRAATALHFDAFVKTLRETLSPESRSALVGTHIDSWEGGGQNWTPGMREEFARRRGYDPLPYLPILTHRVLGDLQTTERFLWDLRQTVSELMVENYVAEFHRLARQENLRFTFEAYTTTGNDLDVANYVDEPMAEFWTPTGQGADFYPTAKSMSSAAHLSGRPVVGAEAFTSGSSEKWLWHPAMFKAIGDDAFAQGVNRFVFHRYAAQRFTDRAPGLQMGPWGLHYERTNTWWEWSGPWHAYLTRCQHLLRQGEFVADVLRLQSEEPLLRFQVRPLVGHDYDACGPDTFRQLAVRDGQLALPTGRAYRLLVLDHTGTMTVPLLARIRDLVRAGAAIVGEAPHATPGLTNLPQADADLRALVAELWGADPTATDRLVGLGRVFSGIRPEAALARLGVPPDFDAGSASRLRWLHRRTADADLYFVANPEDRQVNTSVTFRVTGDRAPEFWQPETGRTTRVALFTALPDATRVRLQLGPRESVFVVFPAGPRKQARAIDPVLSLSRDGRPLLDQPDPGAEIIIEKATYGVPGDPTRTRDVREKTRRLLASAPEGFVVARLAEGDDPAYGVVKTLVVDYTVAGQPFTVTGTDPQRIAFPRPAPPPAETTWLDRDADGRLVLSAAAAGRYEATTAAGRTVAWDVAPPPLARTVGGPWQVRFPPNSGAPSEITLSELASLSLHADSGVRHFSGTATYQKTLTIDAARFGAGRRLTLDLGDVQVMARVTLNGRDLGILWRAPYAIDITDAARPGDNTLEIAVVNLWPNRLIGDEQLPEDSERNKNGTLKAWPKWLLAGDPSPTGRLTFSSWRLWKKDDPLPPSGLLGPVTIRSSFRLPEPDSPLSR
jgi:hypothetical protein